MKTNRSKSVVQKSPPLSRLIFTLTSILLLVGCSIPHAQDTDEPITSEGLSDLSTPSVKIQLSVKLPHALDESETVVLEILDEVTGLPFNSLRFNLTSEDEQTYITSLAFPSGSVVKYHYVKINKTKNEPDEETTIPEATFDDEPIRYRMLYALDNSVVTDIVQAWHGEPGVRETGKLTGTILDRETDLPIPDILVSAGGQTTFTDAQGTFKIKKLPPGVNNVVFYAPDGSYRTYQQGALISADMITPAKLSLQPMPQVEVTFNVSAPSDALGAPIYLAGNLIQLGNTFTDLIGLTSINPKHLPSLSPQDDGTYSITLQLHSKTDLRFKFTLGDGYWNAEQHPKGGFRIRQLIIPDQDVTINLEIASWRSPEIEPITFEVSIPPERSPRDEKYIQFKASDWMSPIPLWPLGAGNYLYILYSPLDDSSPLEYRFCRNANCERAQNAGADPTQTSIQASDTMEIVTTAINQWQNWQPAGQDSPIEEAYIPTKSSSYTLAVELSPEMNPFWDVYAPLGLSKIVDLNEYTVIFTPQWYFEPGLPELSPVIGVTPFHSELTALINTSKSRGLGVALFPQPSPGDGIDSWWGSGGYSEGWWQVWFESYRQFILNYAKIAQETQSEHLILGGKSVLPAFSGGLYPDGHESDVPDMNEDAWLDLIADIRTLYDGDLIWSTTAHREMDPLPDFIYEFDGIYVTIESPLVPSDDADLDSITGAITNIIDSLIYEVYRSTSKPIWVALSYPSVKGATQGCALIDENCFNDGLFLSNETAPYPTDLDEQALIYNAVLPVLTSREWITGIITRGYEPTVVLQDGTSSIAGKPAQDVIQYWFSGLK